MTFSFQPVPSVKDRINEALGRMSIVPEDMPHLHTYLYASLYRPSGFDGDGQAAATHSAMVAEVLDGYTQAVLDAREVMAHEPAFSEVLLTAFAIVRMPDHALRGKCTLLRFNDHIPFILEADRIALEHRRLTGEKPSRHSTYETLCPAARQLFKIRALDESAQALKTLATGGALLDRMTALAHLATYVPLMEALSDAPALRFLSQLAILQAGTHGFEPAAKGDATVIKLPRAWHSRHLKQT